MATTSTIVIEILEDGQMKTNAREAVGTEKEILKELDGIARATGGTVRVEAHEPGAHHHHHHHGHAHVHTGGKK